MPDSPVDLGVMALAPRATLAGLTAGKDRQRLRRGVTQLDRVPPVLGYEEGDVGSTPTAGHQLGDGISLLPNQRTSPPRYGGPLCNARLIGKSPARASGNGDDRLASRKWGFDSPALLLLSPLRGKVAPVDHQVGRSPLFVPPSGGVHWLMGSGLLLSKVLISRM